MKASVFFDLRWQRDSLGYELIDRGRYGYRVVARGGPLVPSIPLTTHTFWRFANLRSHADLVKFMNDFGYLEAVIYDVTDFRGTFSSSGDTLRSDNTWVSEEIERLGGEQLFGECPDKHLAKAKLFGDVVSNFTNRATRKRRLEEAIEQAYEAFETSVSSLEVELNSQTMLRLVAKPETLLVALWIQLCQALQERQNVGVCKLDSCEKVFPVGFGAARRIGSLFCCAEHQVIHNSQKRSKPSGTAVKHRHARLRQNRN